MDILLPEINLPAILPEIFLTLLACGVVIGDLFLKNNEKEKLGIISIGGLLLIFFITMNLFGEKISVFNGMYIIDDFSIFLKLAFIVITIMVITISITYIKDEGINRGEYYSLILFSLLGMMVMAGSGDLIMIYLGIELMALSSYVLVGFNKKNSKSVEASLKYFLTGAFTSGILLYGMALLYGSTGTTNLLKISKFLSVQGNAADPILIVATIMLIAGLGFKIAAVPFHIWAPDVYSGAPTSVTAFLTVGSKFAGFAVMLRLFVITLVSIKPYWATILSILAVLTMFTGNITAIFQTSVKRMLAYSSIAHAGYVLVGVVAANETGVASVLFYALVYTFMNIGAFGIVILVEKKGGLNGDLKDFKGLSQRNPVISLILLIFLLSLAGVPPTAGFTGKFYLFSAAIEAKLLCLAVLGMLSSVISIYYYLRVVMVMYMEDSQQEQKFTYSNSLLMALSVAVCMVIAIGVFPDFFIEAAKSSIFL